MRTPADLSFTIRPARNGFIVEVADDATLPHVFAGFDAAANFMRSEFYSEPDAPGPRRSIQRVGSE